MYATAEEVVYNSKWYMAVALQTSNLLNIQKNSHCAVQLLLQKAVKLNATSRVRTNVLFIQSKGDIFNIFSSVCWPSFS